MSAVIIPHPRRLEGERRLLPVRIVEGSSERLIAGMKEAARRERACPCCGAIAPLIVYSMIREAERD